MIEKIGGNLVLKAQIVFFAVLAVAFVWITGLSMKFQQETLNAAKISDYKTRLSGLDVCRLGTFSKHNADLDEFAQSLLRQDATRGVTVWDATGVKILDRMKAKDGREVDVRRDGDDRITNFQRLEKAKFPFVAETGDIWAPVLTGRFQASGDAFYDENDPPEKVVGFVRVITENRTRLDFGNPQFRHTLLFSLVCWILTALVGHLLLRRTFAPISRIGDTVWAGAAGITCEPVPETRTDDIGQLARGVNRLMEKMGVTEENLAQLTELFESAPDPLVIASTNGDIIRANDRAIRFLGYTSAVDLHRGCGNFFVHLDSHSVPDFQRFFDRLSQGGTRCTRGRSQVFTLIRKDKSVFRAQLTLSFVYDNVMRPVRLIISARDHDDAFPSDEHTNRGLGLNLNRHLRTSNTVAMETMASEINRHLTQITLGIPTLREMWKGLISLPRVREIGDETLIGGCPFSQVGERFPKTCAEILNVAHRVAEIVNGGFEPSPDFRDDDPYADVDLNDVVGSAIGFLNAFLMENPEKFAFTSCRDLPLIQGRHDRLRLMMVNLILHAYQSLPITGTNVSISTAHDKTEKTVVIRIIAEKINYALEPGDSDDDQTELAIAIAKQIVHDHDGNITIDSQPGNGAAFRVSLPI